MEFSNNASEAPNVYFMIVLNSQNYLRGSIITALDVSVNCLFFEAAWAEVYDFNSWLVGLLKKYILWLEISMYNIVLMQEVDSI